MTGRLPNFFVVGAARSGTTALYDYLRQHPQIYMSPIKEPNFFVFYGGGIEYTGPGDQEALQSWYVPSLQAYEAQFSGVRDEPAVGEASPWYLYLPEVPGRIHQHVPEAKLITILRNPVDRAYSAFAALRCLAREPESDFLRAMELEPQRIALGWEPIWHYRAMGMYYEQVRRYFDQFDRDQIRVYLYDDFDRDPAAVMADMLRFLKVDECFLPDMSRRPNQSYVPKNAHLHAFLRQPNRAKCVLKRLLPPAVSRRVRSSAWNQNQLTTGVLPDVRRRLLELFREDIAKLEEILDRDLSGWLESEPRQVLRPAEPGVSGATDRR